jgi:predicted dehydrogenase
MGLEHIQNIKSMPDCKIVAVCDSNRQSLSNAESLLQGQKVGTFANYEDLLQMHDLDVVVIATPNNHHAQVLLDAIESPMHILVEKPLCTTVQDCMQVIKKEALANQQDRLVWVGLEYRYMPTTASLIERIRLGDIGAVKMVSIREHRFPFLKKFDNWNRFNINTGGTLVEKCCHFFDLMHVIAQSEPVQVFASGAQDVNHLDESYDGVIPDILDNAYVTIEFANGVRGSLDLCMFAEASKNEQEISVIGGEGKIEALVTESLIRFGRRSGGVGSVQEEVVSTSSVYSGLHHGASFVEHSRMQEAIRNRRAPEVTLADGLRSVAIGVAAQRSIVERRVVELTEVF